MVPTRRGPLVVGAVAVALAIVGAVLALVVTRGHGATNAGTSPGASASGTPGGASAPGPSGTPTAAASPDAGASGGTSPVGTLVPLAALNGATVTSPVTVTAPDGASEVRWVVDGGFVGKDTGPPYAVTLQLAPGGHKLVARMDTRRSGRQDVRATFTVAAGGAGSTSTGPRPVDAPDPTKGIPPVPKPRRVVPVSTTGQLQAALAGARPGDEIRMADGTYQSGSAFEAAASGTKGAPIVLAGSRAAIVTLGDARGGGYGIHVTGSFWRLVGFTVQRAKKGVVLDGSVGTVLQRLDVGYIGQEAIHFRSSSSNGAVVDCDIHDTGLASPQFGEGVYVGSAHSNWHSSLGSTQPYGSDGGSGPDRSDHILIQGNRIYGTQAEGVDVKEGTTGGVIRGNTFHDDGTSGQNSADSWVDVKGNGWLVEDNTGSGTLADAFQVHQVYDGWGRDNTFRGNSVQGGVPGYVVGVYPAKRPGGNTVACGQSGAGQGTSNIACSR